MLDDELEMIALIERIQDEARMLDENVPGWWRASDAVDRIMASKLCDHVDDEWYMVCQRGHWEFQVQERGPWALRRERAVVYYPL